MNKCGVIVSGGTIDDGFARHVLERVQPGYIIGVDGGLSFLYHSQVMPTHIVGDFDSVPAEVLAYYRDKTDVPIRQFQPEKDETDTEIAVRLAVELGVHTLWILGATGFRLDHVLGNIQILKIAHDAGVKAYIVDANNRISVEEREVRLAKADAFGSYFSVFPFGGIVEKLSIQGAKYPLKDYTLRHGESRCVSNEWEEEEVRITFSEGLIILMETRDKERM